ncbi:hypothetical protein MBLNU459_g2295t1 [Dothideomycetes sp. NU459]
MSTTTLRSVALLALASGLVTLSSAQASGSGSTTRYWDCCKPSCAWSGKASVSAPVTTCDIKDSPLTDTNAVNGCDSGTAYMCSDQSPWAYNSTLAFGFAAVNIAGGSESSWCCSCYKLTFTSTAIAGKTLIVQATNTGGDLGSNQFDLAMPGGGVGIFNGCTAEWGAPSSGWGAQYGGISSDTCSTFPTALQPGCDFRFDWFEGADNPTVDFEQITCPSELTAKTGCTRDGESPVPYASGSGSASTSAAATSSATSAAASSSSAVAASSSSLVAYSSAAASSAEASSSAVSSAAAVASSSAAASSAVASVSTATVVPVAASSAAASSAAVVSSAYSTSSTAVVAPVSSAAATSAAAPSSSAAADDNCQVQYTYVYDL